jgi:8-amino-7-oxononanoate synthase
VPAPPSAVVAVVLGEPDVAVSAARRCAERGLRVGCFRPPSVPPGTARLRLTVMATHEDRHIDWALDALAEARSLVAA